MISIETIETRNEKIEERKEEPIKHIRENLYDRINVSVKTLDKIIVVSVVVLIFFLIIGIYQA